MTKTLAHRGPDGTGISISARAGLGHRRLRIIDLSKRADQPMWNEASALPLGERVAITLTPYDECGLVTHSRWHR